MGKFISRLSVGLTKVYMERLHQKYTDNAFLDILKRLGKWALDTLLKHSHESPAIPKSVVEDKIGRDGLHLGLLTAHSYSSVSNPSAEISVAFSAHNDSGLFWMLSTSFGGCAWVAQWKIC